MSCCRLRVNLFFYINQVFLGQFVLNIHFQLNFNKLCLATQSQSEKDERCDLLTTDGKFNLSINLSFFVQFIDKGTSNLLCCKIIKWQLDN